MWWRGIYFDPKTWDLTDLFMPNAEQGFNLCTEPAADAFRAAGATELKFTPMDEVELNF